MSETRPAAPNPGSRDDADDAETRLAPPPWPASSPPAPAPAPFPPPYGQYAPPYGQPLAQPFGQPSNLPPYAQPYPPQPQPPAYGQSPYGQQSPYQPPPYGYSPPPGPPMLPAPAFDLTRAIEGMRLGDLLAVGGGTLFVLAKFLPFAALQSGRVGFPYAFVYDGWQATNGLWNLLQLLLCLAAIDVALGGFTERFAPVPTPRGVRYLLIGGLLGVTTLFGLIGWNSVRVGLFALLLLAATVVAGGLLKMGIIPGDDRFTMASLNARNRQPGGYVPPLYGSAPPPGGYPPQPPPLQQQQYGAPSPPSNFPNPPDSYRSYEPYGQQPPPQYGNPQPPYNAPPPPGR